MRLFLHALVESELEQLDPVILKAVEDYIKQIVSQNEMPDLVDFRDRFLSMYDDDGESPYYKWEKKKKAELRLKTDEADEIVYRLHYRLRHMLADRYAEAAKAQKRNLANRFSGWLDKHHVSHDVPLDFSPEGERVFEAVTKERLSLPDLTRSSTTAQVEERKKKNQEWFAMIRKLPLSDQEIVRMKLQRDWHRDMPGLIRLLGEAPPWNDMPPILRDARSKEFFEPRFTKPKPHVASEPHTPSWYDTVHDDDPTYRRRSFLD